MIGWRRKPALETEPEDAGGFDAFEIQLGDLMRGERATMGKSLLDVQRELKIKAGYIAAIENANPDAFETQGFISGYVKSYARYLGMDPDETFAAFCRESKFSPVHGMSEAASSKKVAVPAAPAPNTDKFVSPVTPFAPEDDPIFASVEPRAIGSVAVLIALIAGLGYGGWSVLNEIQRVEFAPVDQTPEVVANLDPLAGAGSHVASERPSAAAFDRLYRPAALDVPLMESRDAPIATLLPRISAPAADSAAPQPAPVALAEADTTVSPETPTVQVTAAPEPGVTLLAVRPVWVRVRAADGTVVLEKVLDAGEEYAIPPSEEPPTLRAGNSGSLFFRVAGQVYGPAGPGTTVAKNVALDSDGLPAVYALADPAADTALADYVAVAQVAPEANAP